MSARHAFTAGIVVALLAACATTPAPPPAVPSGTAVPVQASDLPDGAGRKILQTHCTWCHDLREVTKFRGFYNRAQWRDIVTTMVQYGAEVNEKEVEVLADYLDANFGRSSK